MIPVYDLTSSAWVVLIIAGLLIGVAKTALPGLATIAVAMFAAVLPAKESTAVMLLLLLVGDLLAVWAYRKDVDWGALRSLVPPVFIGLIVGAVVLDNISDTGMRKMIGIILLTLTGITLVLMLNGRRKDRAAALGEGSVVTEKETLETAEIGEMLSPSTEFPQKDSRDRSRMTTSSEKFAKSPLARWTYGFIGSFTTMVANSGGPPMTMYFLASGFDMLRFLGTQAWFFFIVNIAKVPFQATLGLHSGHSLTTDLLLLPTVLVGAFLGRRLVRYMNPAIFNPLIISLTVLSSAYLLF